MDTVLTHVWSRRPGFLHLGLFFAAYLLGCGFAQSLAIVPGTGISIWPPSGLFIATLVLAPMPSWPWWVVAGGLAELVGNALWFHSPLPAAVLIYVGNALEAMAGAWLVNRFCRRPVRLETLGEVLAFVVLTAGLAPVVSATVGSATLAWFGIQSQQFVMAWPLWWIGDATGVLIVAPLALVVFQDWRAKARLSASQWMEAAALGLIFLGAAALSLSGYLPFAYMIMPPLLWAAVRFEFRGAAVMLILLALITAAFTVSGLGEFAGDPESQKQKQVMLHLFLAVSALSALIVAALSRQHRQAVAALRDRERELSQLVDMVPGHLWRLTPEGEPIFFNKRMSDFLGLDVAATVAPGRSGLEALIETIHPEDAATFRNTLNRCLATGEGLALRYRLRRADGIYRWMSSRAEPLRDRNGRIVQWYGLCHDIDDQVHAEQAVRDSERELSQIVDMVPIHIARMTPDGETTFFNKRLKDFYLANLDSPGPGSLDDVIKVLLHPDDAAGFGETVRRSLATGEGYSMKYRMRRADGVYRWREGRAEPVRNREGEIVEWYAISMDIDDEVRAQEALRESERRYRHLFHYMPMGLTQVDAGKLIPMFKELRAQGVTDLRPYIDEHPEFLPRAVAALEVEEVNQHIVGMFGAKNAEEMRGPITRYWQPGMATIRRSIEARYRGEEVFQEETKVARMDGSVMDVLFTTARPGAVADKSLVGFIDITERKKAEEALREREREFSQLVNMVPIPLWRLTPEGEPTFFNKRLIDLFGHEVADYEQPGVSLLAAAIATFVHPDDSARMAEALNHCIATGDSFSLKYRVRRADGVYRWVEGRAEPMRYENGRIGHWYGVLIDIDDGLRAEEALRQSERRLLQLVETLPAMIYCAAPNGEPTYRSRQLREYLGFDVQEKEGPGGSRLTGTLDAVIHPDELAAVKERYGHSLLTGEPYALKHRLRRADGEYRWVETRAAAMRNAEGTIVQWNGICLDIEDQVRAQQRLSLAQESLARAGQAASLAELSASIAHEVNQPLAAVVANSHACQRWLTAEPPNIGRAQKTVERIIRDANSAADVVSHIRALFRQSVEPRASAALPGVVAEARNLMAEEAARRHVRLEADVESDLPRVAFDRVQIQQVLVNLIRNGMDAMDSAAGERVVAMRVRRAGDAIQTEISDRGRGVAFPDRIFEPFFTTKEDGMGMGLAICRSIVESHGGRLWVEENKPHGAKFIFTLPIEAKTAS